MSLTTFSGPVASQNGFIGGTAASPIAVKTAGNVSSSYVTSSAATGDTRLSYSRLDITSTGSGETLRAFTRVSGANAATGGTVNGAHISLSVNSGGSISGADGPTLTIDPVTPADAGTYKCVVATPCGSDVSNGADLTVNAAPPCYADFNQDGGIDGDDIVSFYMAWESGDSSADVNQDGGVDGSDSDAFYAAWEAGGC